MLKCGSTCCVCQRALLNPLHAKELATACLGLCPVQTTVCVQKCTCVRLLGCSYAGERRRCAPEGSHEADDADGHGDGAEGDEGHSDDEEVEHAPAGKERGRREENEGQEGNSNFVL